MNKRAVLGVICAGSAFFATQISALAFADETDFSITVRPSLNLSVSSNNVSFSITPSKNGAYNSASFNVYSSTNNSTGYTLTMSTNNVNLKSSTINVNTGDYPIIPTIAESQEGISAEAFTATTSTDYLNHYGISIAGANFNAMKAEKEIKVTDENNTTQDTTVIAIASKLDLNTVPGTYSTTINFQLVANSTDPVQPYPDDPCDSDPNCDSTSGTTLQRAYELAYTAAHKGMYEETTAGSNVFQYIDSWGGVQYQGQGRDVRFLIQDMTPSICNTATVVGSTALVLDVRDQTSYRIVKAADGRCWMQDNLALDLTNSTVLGNLSTTNTNADTNSLTSLRSGNRANGGQYATAGVANWSSSHSYSVPLINTTMKNSKPTVDEYDDTDPLASSVDGDNWRVGIYYNYCAASAGSYCYGNGANSSVTGSTAADKPNTAIDAEYDICPSGWRLPTGEDDYDEENAPPDSGENLALASAYPSISGGDSQGIRTRKALRVPLSGEIDFDGSLYDYGGVAIFFTSSTIADSPYSYYLLIDNNFTGYYSDPTKDMSHGISVRCINKTGTEPAPSGN